MQTTLAPKRDKRFTLLVFRVISSLYVKVLWCRTSTQSLDMGRYLKFGLEDAFNVRLLLSVDPFNQSSVDIHFSLSISTKNMFDLSKERSSVNGSIGCLWNQIGAKLLVATFVKGLCRGTISQYFDLWRWGDIGWLLCVGLSNLVHL